MHMLKSQPMLPCLNVWRVYPLMYLYFHQPVAAQQPAGSQADTRTDTRTDGQEQQPPQGRGARRQSRHAHNDIIIIIMFICRANIINPIFIIIGKDNKPGPTACACQAPLLPLLSFGFSFTFSFCLCFNF